MSKAQGLCELEAKAPSPLDFSVTAVVAGPGRGGGPRTWGRGGPRHPEAAALGGDGLAGHQAQEMTKAADVGTEAATGPSARLQQRWVNVVTGGSPDGGCPRSGVGRLGDRKAPPPRVFAEQSYGASYEAAAPVLGISLLMQAGTGHPASVPAHRATGRLPGWGRGSLRSPRVASAQFCTLAVAPPCQSRDRIRFGVSAAPHLPRGPQEEPGKDRSCRGGAGPRPYPAVLLGPHTASGELQTQDLRSHSLPGSLNSFSFPSWPVSAGSLLWVGLQIQSKEP